MASDLIEETSGPGIELADLGLAEDARGVLPSQSLARAVDLGIIHARDTIDATQIQPASVDLRLGDNAFRIRSSFLPDARPVEVKLKELAIGELDLRDGAVLEVKTPYLIPLAEQLHLPPYLRGRTNPKSSTGRLDVFTRVITDQSFRFDEIRLGYHGHLYLEVVPLSFPVKVKQGLTLNQLRLATGVSKLSDAEIGALHAEQPLLYREREPMAEKQLAIADGLFLSLDLKGDADGRVGYQAKESTRPIDMGKSHQHEWEDYWDPVRRERNGYRIVLTPERFYLLLSDEAVRIPPGYAAEMTAYDPTSGELRTHYAGFFDPGFGFDASGEFHGSRAALEVRAHDVPFMIEHRQRVAKLSFERMAGLPLSLYGASVGSSYQLQTDTLSKHFKQPRQTEHRVGARRVKSTDHPELFESEPSDPQVRR